MALRASFGIHYNLPTNDLGIKTGGQKFVDDMGEHLMPAVKIARKLCLEEYSDEPECKI